MDQIVLVRRCQTRYDADEKLNGFANMHGAVSDPVSQRTAIVIRHDHKETAFFVLFKSIDRANIGMVESRDGTGFFEQTLLIRFPAIEGFRQKLECDNTVESAQRSPCHLCSRPSQYLHDLW